VTRKPFFYLVARFGGFFEPPFSHLTVFLMLSEAN
jgi:hypothetical protein